MKNKNILSGQTADMMRTKAYLPLQSNNSFLCFRKKKKKKFFMSVKNKWVSASFFSMAQSPDAAPHQFGQWRVYKKV